MKYIISPDRKTLTITADELERTELHELGEDVHQDRTMHDWLEPLPCNSELEWIDPSETGDLTAAPMLGILGEERRDDRSPRGYRQPRRCMGCGMMQPILSRWAFLGYETKSVLEALRANGECVFVGGDL